MTTSKHLFIALATAATVWAAQAGTASAQPMPGNHPHYLHALTDLRTARGMLEKPTNAPGLRWDEHVAIREIDAAIKEIKDAAIDDGKDLSEHPPVDTNLDWNGRLHAAVKLLAKAHQDASGDEDNGAVRGLRHRSLEHIDRAAQVVKDGIAEADAWRDNGAGQDPGSVHPAYLHALTDLRAARAHLDRPANTGATQWDEHKAIREIDAAIRAIKDAAVDDGKALDEHPPVDTNLDWGGRLHHCLELVQKAHSDINQEEDNGWARHLKRNALGHIDMAARFIQQGIDNNHY